MVIATQSSGTRSFSMAKDYFENLLFGNEKGLADSLAEEVQFIWERSEGGSALNSEEINGKEEVLRTHRGLFFVNAKSFYVKEQRYSNFGLQAILHCEVCSQEGGAVTGLRACHTVYDMKLDFKEEQGSPKIVKIWAKTSKNLPPPSKGSKDSLSE